MGSVFKKVVTRPLPAGAELIVRKGERLARWRDARGKTRTAPVTTAKDGSDRIRDESSTYYARHRDGNSVVVETPTGCRDKTAAQAVLADLERRAEKVRAGLLIPAEARSSEHLARPIGEHFDAYMEAMKAQSHTRVHRDTVRGYLDRLAADCEFSRLADLRRDALERWLARQADAGRSARSRNAYHAAAVSFARWCVGSGRLTVNPFHGIAKADEKADPRRKRRAMTEAELTRLLDVARRRPLLDTLTVHKGKRKGEAYANVRPEVRERLERLTVAEHTPRGPGTIRRFRGSPQARPNRTPQRPPRLSAPPPTAVPP